MSRFHASIRLAFWIALGAALLLGMIFMLKAWKGMPTEQLTRDPNALFDAPLYVGFLSQAGIFFWAGAITMCFYTAWLVPAQGMKKEVRYFLVSSGLLTLMLGLDDVFLLHEQFFPFIGIPEKAVYAAYGGTTLFVLIRFHRLILETQFPLLAAALSLFAISMSLDWLQLEGIDIFLFEDGAKLVGIMCWLAYFSHSGHNLATAYLRAKHTIPADPDREVEMEYPGDMLPARTGMLSELG